METAHRLFCPPPSSTENLIIPFAEADNASGHVRGTGVAWKKREEEELFWCLTRYIVTIAQETAVVFIVIEGTDMVLIGWL